ncbi:MAG: SDR family oxidoreductase [Cyclobacteriaceae bacterium]
MSELNSKNILVVGGSSGIGLEVVKQATALGAQVWSASRNNTEELQTTDAKFIQLDVTSEDIRLDDLPDQLDALVYCPGTINLKPFHRLKVEDFQKDFDINVLGAVKVIQAALPRLKKSEAAAIVTFSTVAVQQGMGFHASVAAAKGAIEGLSRSLAAELSPQNIRVNCIAPSLTDTPLAAQLLSTPEKREASEKRHPIKKVGKAADLAATAIYLISGSSEWITGQVWHVDGGMSSIKSL